MDVSISTATTPPRKRITEYSNAFTAAMDSATPEEFVRMLRQVSDWFAVHLAY